MDRGRKCPANGAHNEQQDQLDSWPATGIHPKLSWSFLTNCSPLLPFQIPHTSKLLCQNRSKVFPTMTTHVRALPPSRSEVKTKLHRTALGQDPTSLRLEFLVLDNDGRTHLRNQHEEVTWGKPCSKFTDNNLWTQKLLSRCSGREVSILNHRVIDLSSPHTAF